MRTQLVNGLFADLLQVVRFLRVYAIIALQKRLIHSTVTLLNCYLQQSGYLKIYERYST